MSLFLQNPVKWTYLFHQYIYIYIYISCMNSQMITLFCCEGQFVEWYSFVKSVSSHPKILGSFLISCRIISLSWLVSMHLIKSILTRENIVAINSPIDEESYIYIYMCVRVCVCVCVCVCVTFHGRFTGISDKNEKYTNS